MNFESLIFDIDGTLWDSRALVAEGYNAQLEKEGLRHLFVNPEILATVFGKTMTEIADILLAELPEADRYPTLERCMASEDVYLAKYSSEAIAYPGVKKTLEELSRKYRLFIVSNSQSGYPQLVIEKLGLEHLIRGHLCFGDTGTCKGETILRLMREHGISSACYIGDTLGDQEAADYAGIPFVHCTFGFGQAEHCIAAVDRFEELLNL